MLFGQVLCDSGMEVGRMAGMKVGRDLLQRTDVEDGRSGKEEGTGNGGTGRSPWTRVDGRNA